MLRSILTIILSLLACTALSQENGIQFFEKNIRPVLNKQCYFQKSKIYEENYNISIVIKQSYVVNDWNINIINYR